MKGGALLGLLLGILAACEPAAERCRRIDSEAFHSRAQESSEERFAATLYGTPGYDTLSDSLQWFTRRALRAQHAIELRRFIDSSAQLRGDTLMSRLLAEATPAQDSAEPDPAPPPKPSDLAWYTEHCYEGKAR